MVRMKPYIERSLELRKTMSWMDVATHVQPEFMPDKTIEQTRRTIKRECNKYQLENGLRKKGEQDRSFVTSTIAPSTKKSSNANGSTVEYKQDGTVISERLIQIIEARSKDVRYILEAHGFNADEWDVVSCRNNIWGGNNSEEAKVSCQSKITVKPKAKGLSLEAIDEHFAKMDREFISPERHYSLVDIPDCMAVVHLADVHLGKLCWHGDTAQDYDQHIARETFMRLISEIATELSMRSPEYITFVWSNDFFNSDTTTNTTTAGTPMDSTDLRFTKLFNVGCDLLVSAIEALATIAPVKTFYISSNHSELTDYHALQYLKAWFRKDENVTVNIDAFPRKYVLYGNTLLGFTHGGKEKARNLALLMPIEARDLWSQSKYAELHCAHLHSEQMIVEGNGVIIRRIASPTPSDNWHTDNGYIGNVRKAQTFVYDKNKGLTLTINTPV